MEISSNIDIGNIETKFDVDEYFGLNQKRFAKILHKCKSTGKSIATSNQQKRSRKNKSEQVILTRKNGEVFTPVWVCDKMISSCEEDFKDISWQDYIKIKWLEITCGEAPYLVSRYDATTDEYIPIKKRIGILDRKLRKVCENTETEKDFITWAKKAFQATYGYEFQKDSLIQSRKNLIYTFIEYFHSKFNKEPNISEVKKIADIIAWNIFYMDGLKYTVPNDKIAFVQQDIDSYVEDQNFYSENINQIVFAKIRAWKNQKEKKDIVLDYKGLSECEDMKFGVVIGNPPYQETIKEATTGNNKNTVDIFQMFQEEAFKIGSVIHLIYPAKEYQRGKKNTLNKHLIKLRIYNGSGKEAEKNIPDEEAIFGQHIRRIPGDVGTFYWDMQREEELICYQDILIERTDKILPVRKEFISISKKLSDVADSFKFSDVKKVCESNFIEKNPDKVLNKAVIRGETSPSGYTKVLTNNKAGSGGKSKWFYIKTSSLDRIQPNTYKVIISSAFPNEAFKNPDNIEILNKDEMFGRSKLAIYDSNDLQRCEHFIKYLRTTFVKLIVQLTPYKFLYYLPDFNAIYSDIDWSLSTPEIDKQLYKKYNLSPDEINFIESRIKPME